MGKKEEIKRNILFINGHLNVGGCERSLVDVLKKLDYSKYNVDLLLLEELGDYQKEVPENVKVFLYSLNNAFGSFFSCMKNAIKNRDYFSIIFRICWIVSKRIDRKFLKVTRSLFKQLAKNYDVIIAYRPGICTELAAYVFDAQKKVSWWHHGEMNYEGVARNELHKSYYQMDKIIAVSRSSAKLIQDTFPDISEKICVVPNMICINELQTKSQAEENVFRDFMNQLVLVSVGRMSPEKNMKLCVEVGKELKKIGVPYKWYMVGDGVEYTEIKEIIRTYNLQQELIMVGKKNNPYPYICAADILVHPSLVESYGITILESMALRTPVIVVESEGPKEFIENGENGVLVKPNQKVICEQIRKFYFNEFNKSRMVEKGLMTVERYSVDTVMKKVGKVLEGEM